MLARSGPHQEDHHRHQSLQHGIAVGVVGQRLLHHAAPMGDHEHHDFHGADCGHVQCVDAHHDGNGVVRIQIRCFLGADQVSKYKKAQNDGGPGDTSFQGKTS